MSTFEKMPPRAARTVVCSEIFVAGMALLLWTVLVAASIRNYLKSSTTITVPPLPSNYAVLATDGKGHLFWEAVQQSNPYGPKEGK